MQYLKLIIEYLYLKINNIIFKIKRFFQVKEITIMQINNNNFVLLSEDGNISELLSSIKVKVLLSKIQSMKKPYNIIFTLYAKGKDGQDIITSLKSILVTDNTSIIDILNAFIVTKTEYYNINYFISLKIKIIQE